MFALSVNASSPSAFPAQGTLRDSQEAQKREIPTSPSSLQQSKHRPGAPYVQGVPRGRELALLTPAASAWSTEVLSKYLLNY